MAAAEESSILTNDFLEMLKEIVENDNKKMSDDTVSVAPIAFWTQLFASYFLHVNNPHHDDLLFYVKKDPLLHEEKSEVKVFRRESPKNPGLGDPNFDWTETVYLNLILQQLHYKLTCAICNKHDSSEVVIHKQVSQVVYASPSKRDMDGKGHSEELSYPSIYFPIDSFDEIWTGLYLNPGEMVCVEVVAHDNAKKFQSVIFLGSVSYEALIKVYEKKVGALGSSANKWASFMSLGLYKSPSEVQFVKMKGPGGKGYAEMATEKYKQDSKRNDETMSSPGCSSPSSPAMVTSKSEPDSLYKHTVKKTTGKSQSSIVALSRSETKRNPSSASLKTQLTYVSLPWHKIILDVLKSYEEPSSSKKPVLGT